LTRLEREAERRGLVLAVPDRAGHCDTWEEVRWIAGHFTISDGAAIEFAAANALLGSRDIASVVPVFGERATFDLFRFHKFLDGVSFRAGLAGAEWRIAGQRWPIALPPSLAERSAEGIWPSSKEEEIRREAEEII
jgi:hypothetical protein